MEDERWVPGLGRLIATHHKTGTALMHDIFKTIAGNFSGYGRFVDIRDMEDHPDQFSAQDKVWMAASYQPPHSYL